MSKNQNNIYTLVKIKGDAIQDFVRFTFQTDGFIVIQLSSHIFPFHFPSTPEPNTTDNDSMLVQLNKDEWCNNNGWDCLVLRRGVSLPPAPITIARGVWNTLRIEGWTRDVWETRNDPYKEAEKQKTSPC